MSSLEKWRAVADKALSAPVKRQRNFKSVAGKVEDRFDAILSARRRGMPWPDIAKALEDGASIKVDAVESAFKRICLERDISPPRRRITAAGDAGVKSNPLPAQSASQQTFFDQGEERWVDDGE